MARWLGREPDLRPKRQAPSYNMGVVCCSYKLSPTRANVRSVPEADKSLSVCADRLKVGAAWNESYPCLVHFRLRLQLPWRLDQ